MKTCLPLLAILLVFVSFSCNKSEPTFEIGSNILTESSLENDTTFFLRQDDNAWDSIGIIGKKYTLKLLNTNTYLDSTIFLNAGDFASALGMSIQQVENDFQILRRNAEVLRSYYPDSTDYCNTCELSDPDKLHKIKSLLINLDADNNAKNTFISNLSKVSYTTARLNGVSSGGCSLGYYICVDICVGSMGELPPLCIACIFMCACEYCTNTPGCQNL